MSDAEATPTFPADAQRLAHTPSPSACLHTPVGNSTPRRDNDDTSQEGQTPSPHRVDDAPEESFQNPEPPKELADLLNADSIGDTVFSKHWLFTTLMRLLEVLKSYIVNSVRCRQKSVVTVCKYGFSVI